MTDDTTTSADSVLAECAAFLYHEAELLDANRFLEWLELLSEDLEYEVPIRLTRERTARDLEFSPTGYHMFETRGSLQTRVNRLLTEHAWAEDPPSRTTRFVTNVRLAALEGETASVDSNLLLYRSQGDRVEYDLLVGMRCDVLRRVDGDWKLARRRVLLAHTTLGTSNLGVFL
jgi:3-phenylpropionate/cinnamic acid dioxygenase small subunit